MISTSDWMITSAARVAISRTRAAARRNSRRTTAWKTIATAAASTTPTTAAGSVDHPEFSFNVRKLTKAATIAIAPWAKFTTPDPR